MKIKNSRFWREQETNTYRMSEYEIEMLKHLATNCIAEIKSNTEVIQLLDKGEEVRKG